MPPVIKFKLVNMSSSNPQYWQPGEDFLQNSLHFPSFEELPREGELVKTYWKQQGKKKAAPTPACTWFFMGEIINDEFSQMNFLHNRVLVCDRDDQDNIPIAFYPKTGFMDYKLLKNCNTIFVASAQKHKFLDSTVGLRVEDLNTVSIAPCTMEEMFTLSQTYHDCKETRCWWCGVGVCPSCLAAGRTSTCGPGAGEEAGGLKKCSACKVARYCSKECQYLDWKEGGHKWCCKAMPIFLKLTKINYTRFDTTALLGPAHFIPGLLNCKKS